MSLTDEIITLQFGKRSNFTGAHWWNFQKANFIYPGSKETSEINHDVLFREGMNLCGEKTFTPRVLITDFKEHVGSHLEYDPPYENGMETDEAEAESASNIWHDKIDNFDDILQEHREGLIANNADVAKPSWTNFLETVLHPKSLTLVDHTKKFESFPEGSELWNSNFQEEWSDKCRWFSEECDYLKGFQILFDCHDGFSGLAVSAMTYLRDEYPGKTFLAFGSFDSDGDVTSKTINAVSTFAAIPECCSAFVPLSLRRDGWRNNPPYTYNHIFYQENSDNDVGAILAAFLDTVTLGYRGKTTASRNISTFLQTLAFQNRIILTGGLTLPFPILAGSTAVTSLKTFRENPLKMSVSPNAIAASREMYGCLETFRGLTRYHTTVEGQTLDQLWNTYARTKYLCATYSGVFFDLPAKIPKSFPKIFRKTVTATGCVVERPIVLEYDVTETAVCAGLYNCDTTNCMLKSLWEDGLKYKIKNIPHFDGMEQLEYSETLEKLCTFAKLYEL